MIASRLILGVALATAATAANPPRIPDDAPYCAPPKARPLFVSPMGEPFRAEPGQPYPSARWFAGADANRDGAIVRAELIGDADRFFRTIDLDHDGRLTPEEVIAYERDVAPEIAVYGARSRDYAEPPRRGRPADGEYGGAMGAGRYAWLNIPEPVSGADADVDRVVSRDEFLAAAGRRFDALAGGRDRLTLAALPRTPLQIAIEGPCRPRPKPRKGDRDGDRPSQPGDPGERREGRMPR